MVKLSPWSLESILIAINSAKDDTGVNVYLRAEDALQPWVVQQMMDAMVQISHTVEDICVITGQPKK